MTSMEGTIAGTTAGSGTSTAAPIAVRSLTKRYGRVVAVDDLSFEAHAGRVTAFLGPNGAGKSTTLRVLLGLVKATAGEATVDGKPFAELPDPTRRIGAVMEESTAHPGRTARNHLRILATIGDQPFDRVEDVLEIVDLRGAADRRVGGFSMGMRQRLSLAAALLGEPKVLVLDEPANGLDPAGIRWLRELLRGRAATGATVLVSSHVLSEVAQLADDAVVIDHGRLVRAAPLVELVGGSLNRYRVRTPKARELAEALAREGASFEVVDPGELLVGEESVDLVVELAAERRLPLREMAPEGTLEDVFLRLLGGGDGEEGR